MSTTIISACALGLSFVNFLILLKDKRKNFSVLFEAMYINEYAPHNNVEQDAVKIKYIISNRSQLPISITRIRMMIDDNYYDVDYLSHYVESGDYTQHGELISRNILESTVLPIQLSVLGASSGFLAFTVPRGLLTGNEKTLKFQICTNRGKPIETEITFQEEKKFKRLIF